MRNVNYAINYLVYKNKAVMQFTYTIIFTMRMSMRYVSYAIDYLVYFIAVSHENNNLAYSVRMLLICDGE